jgi:hypothetical protein
VLRADEVHRLLEEPPAAVLDDPPAIRVRDDLVCELLYGSGWASSWASGSATSTPDAAP